MKNGEYQIPGIWYRPVPGWSCEKNKNDLPAGRRGALATEYCKR